MKDFRFKVPQNIEFGVGSLKKLPEILNESKSEHVFLISDEGLAKLGVVKKVPAVVGIAMIGTIGPGTLYNPS